MHAEELARLKPNLTTITSYRENTSKISKMKFEKPAVGVFNSISPAGQTIEFGTKTSGGKDVLVDKHSLLLIKKTKDKYSLLRVLRG